MLQIQKTKMFGVIKLKCLHTGAGGAEIPVVIPMNVVDGCLTYERNIDD